MRIARTLLTVICWAGVVVSSLLLAIHLSTSGVPFVGQVAGLSVLLAVVLLAIILVFAQIMCRSDASKKEAIASLEKWSTIYFIKITAAGLILGGTFYLIWLVFAPDRLSIRGMFLMVSFGYPVVAFDKAIADLLRLGGYLPDLPKPFRVTGEGIKAIRGRFREKRSERVALGILAICFIVIPLVVLMICAFDPGSKASSDANRVTCIFLGIMWIVLWIFLWFAWDNEWEFTGTEIIVRHGSFVRWRVPIDSVARGEVELTPERVAFLHVFTAKRRYSMRLVPELLDLLRQSAEEREKGPVS